MRTSSSLRLKILIFLAVSSLIITFGITRMAYVIYSDSMTELQIRLASGTANLVASNIDPERVDDFLLKGEKAEGYLETKEQLQAIQESTPEIEYVYVYKILKDGCHVVFDADTEELEGEKPGTIIPFDMSFGPYINDLLEGKPVEPVISNDRYGWLLTLYEPVLNKDGECVCYAGADISMHQIREHNRVFLTKVITLFSGIFIIILVIGAWLAEYNVILPINTMAGAAGAFAYDTEKARTASTRQIREMHISTGDEIENLYHSLVKTSEDTAKYIEEDQKKNETINRLQNGLILVLADVVESRDLCTGNHVRNTSKYTEIIARQMKADGVYTDQLTEQFIEDVTSSAPLHDVGKIQIPDDILNKPGKLTDEEFELMKTHTVKGAEILDKAISMVSEKESGYLQEAKNLAEFHHEKWNGKGYPVGLSAEEIPLSARIMAVADVFDALISRRSYKEPFSVDKAFEIIQEGSGTHFDPKVVNAFSEARDQICEVTREGDS